MASGSFNITRTSGSTYLSFKVNWVSYSNGSASNSSDIDVWVWVSKSSSSTAGTWGQSNTTVVVDGTTKSENNFSFSVNPGGEVLIFAKRYSGIAHGADGKKSVTISVSVGGNIMGASGSKEVALDTIPRQATLLTAPDFNDEENPTITYSNPAGNAVTALRACISWTGGADIAYRDIPATGKSYTFEFTPEERLALQRATLPENNGQKQSNSRTVVFYVTTWFGNTVYYSTLNKTLTIINCEPTLSPTIIDVNTHSTMLTGDNTKLIKGYSIVDASTGAAALKEASLVDQTITCGNQTVHASSTRFDPVNSGTFSFTATDNRGNTTTRQIVRDVVDYTKLTCVINNGNPTVDGDFDFSVSGNYFNGSFGAVTNSLKVEWRYKTAGGEYPKDDLGNDIWTSFENVELTELGYNAAVNITGLDYRSTYTFQARAADEVYANYIQTTERVVRALPTFDWGEDDFNFNVPVFKEGNPMGYYPIGGIYMSSDNTDPGELFGGTWELERRFYGGELLAYGSCWNDSPCSFQGVNGTDYGFSDSLYGGTFASHIQNYLPDVLTPSSGTIWVQTKGVIGLIEADVEISGGNSGCTGIWFLSKNKNTLPSFVRLSGGQGLLAVTGTYSGASTKYFYDISDTDAGTDFFVNPMWKPYGGNFNPGIAGTKSTLHIKAYAKGKVAYVWKRIA